MKNIKTFEGYLELFSKEKYISFPKRIKGRVKFKVVDFIGLTAYLQSKDGTETLELVIDDYRPSRIENHVRNGHKMVMTYNIDDRTILDWKNLN